jgi:hypothetical protein
LPWIYRFKLFAHSFSQMNMSFVLDARVWTHYFQRRTVSSFSGVRRWIFYYTFTRFHCFTIQYSKTLVYCLQCGSGRSVAPIKAGFVARVGRRNAGAWFGLTFYLCWNWLAKQTFFTNCSPYLCNPSLLRVRYGDAFNGWALLFFLGGRYFSFNEKWIELQFWNEFFFLLS